MKIHYLEILRKIFKMRQRGIVIYAMAPFVIGTWEFQLNHLDREMA